MISEISYKLLALLVLWSLRVFQPARNLSDPGHGIVLTAIDNLVCRLSIPTAKHFNATTFEENLCAGH